ncbi:MAG: inositol 2-dehydrogenase [Paenibacillaceae bacterium]|nr:inositol 2-dehydrogenase [Paenibacillaceae bacterium]
MKKLTVGIAGAGRIGRIHAENLLGHAGARVKTVADLAPDRIRAWASGLSIPNVTADAGDIVADPEIDAILICSPTDTHTALIEQAARAGKAIFCEKPVSLDIGQTRQAVAAAERNGVLLQIGFNRRFDPSFSRARALVQAGEAGEPHIVSITSRDPAPPPSDYIRVSGGMFLDMTIHDFDMARFLCGSEVEAVHAEGAVLVDPAIGGLGDIDTAVTTLRFASGAIGVINNSRRAAYGFDQRAEVFGSKGSVAVRNEWPNTVEFSAGDGVRRDKPHYFFLERYSESYRLELDSFLDAVRNGMPAAVTGDDALRAERIAAAAKRSFAERRTVAIAEIETEIWQAG